MFGLVKLWLGRGVPKLCERDVVMSEVGDEFGGRLALRFQAGLDWVIDGRQMQRGRDIGLLWHTKSGRRQQRRFY